jgi:hypothetical protein
MMIENSTFLNQEAYGYGGAIYGVDGGEVFLRNVTMTNGHAEMDGGTLYLQNVLYLNYFFFFLLFCLYIFFFFFFYILN